MKIAIAENLRHFLGDLTKDDARVFVHDPDSDGFFEVDSVTERDGHAVIKLGQFWHSWRDLQPESQTPEDP